MDDHQLARVLGELLDPDGPEVIRIGSLPTECLVQWPSSVTNEVVVTRTQRSHYLANHPEMIGFEFQLIQALLEPDIVFEILDAENTLLCLICQDEQHGVVVIVSISSTPGLSNSVITARRQRRGKRGKPASRQRMIWKSREK